MGMGLEQSRCHRDRGVRVCSFCDRLAFRISHCSQAGGNAFSSPSAPNSHARRKKPDEWPEDGLLKEEAFLVHIISWWTIFLCLVRKRLSLSQDRNPTSVGSPAVLSP